MLISVLAKTVGTATKAIADLPGAIGAITPIAKGAAAGAVESAVGKVTEAVNEATGIPLETPNSSTTSAPAVRGTYKGFISHFHLKKNKIDCAGLDLKQLIIDINEGDY